MMLLTPQNYNLWIKEIRKLATQHKVWLYIDPDEDIEKPKLKIPRISDHQVKVTAADETETTRPAQLASELTDA